MTKLVETLRALGLHNTHALLVRFGQKGKDIALMFYSAEARACRPPKTTVYSPSHATNPAAHWTDNKCKAFVGKRATSMPAAEAWATEKYSVTEWAPCPFDRSARIPKYVRDAAVAAAKEAA